MYKSGMIRVNLVIFPCARCGEGRGIRVMPPFCSWTCLGIWEYEQGLSDFDWRTMEVRPPPPRPPLWRRVLSWFVVIPV